MLIWKRQQQVQVDHAAAGAAGGTDSTEAWQQHRQTSDTQLQQQVQQVCLRHACACQVMFMLQAAAPTDGNSTEAADTQVQQ